MAMETPPTGAKKILVKSLNKFSLTPCRRVGLCRPSSGSLKKSLHLKSLNSSVHNESSAEKKNEAVPISSDRVPSLDCEDRLKTPLKTSDVLNKSSVPKVRRCLSTGPSTSQSRVKRTLSKNESNTGEFSDLKSDTVTKLDGLINNDFGENKRLKLDSVMNIEKNENTNKIKTTVFPSNSSATTEVEKTHQRCETIQQLILSIKEKKKKLESLKVQETYAKKHNLEELRAQTAKWRTAGQDALRFSLTLARQAGFSVTLQELMTQHGFPLHLMGYNADDDEFD